MKTLQVVSLLCACVCVCVVFFKTGPYYAALASLESQRYICFCLPATNMKGMELCSQP